MKQFDIVVNNKMSALGEVCDILSKNAINIKAIAADLRNGTGIIKVVTEDEKSTSDVLEKTRLEFSSHDILPLTLIDRPGELGKVSKLLSRYNVSVESVFILGKLPERGETHVALKVNDRCRAEEVLKGYIAR